MSATPPEINQVELRIPFLTLAKVVGVAALTLLIVKIAPILEVLFLAMLLAVTLRPVFCWMQQRKVPFAGLILTIGVLGTLAGTVVLILPSLVNQISGLATRFPEMQKSILAQAPPSGFMHDILTRAITAPNAKNLEAWGTHLLTAGQVAMGGLASFILLLILMLYLTIDGHRAYSWLIAFVPARHRTQLGETSEEMSKVIFAYVAGQLITSLLCSIFAFGTLTLLKVPAALTLALMAGVFDVLPVLGFFMSTIPALLLALTVSPSTALYVLLLYFGYHQLENYLIVPKVYGTRLRLSDLVVLLSVLIGWVIAGVPGAIAILPIVASYSIIERIWLVDYLGPRVVQKHVKQDKEKSEKKPGTADKD